MIKMLDHLGAKDLLSVPQVGKIVDNKDPRMLLRVKVYIKGIYEDADPNKLPWCFPKPGSDLGGRPDSSSFHVPEIGSEVSVFWPNRDLYHPFYEGRRVNELTAVKAPYDESYPNSYGQIDSTKQWFKVNKETGMTEFYSDTLKKMIQFDGEGNLVLNIPKSMILKIAGEVQISVGGSSILSSGNNVVITAGQDIYMSAGRNISSTGGGTSSSYYSGALNVRSGASINLDAPIINENCGIAPGPAPAPGEISALQQAVADIQAKITQLTQTAQAIADRVAANLDKIGK